MLYNKKNKGKLKKLQFKKNYLRFGKVGLKTMNSGILNSKHIEAARQAITRKIKKSGKIWIRVVLNLPVTTKPTGIRMGKGKGTILYNVVRVRSGTVLFEICGVSLNSSIIALKAGKSKLPLKTKIFI